MRQRKFEHKETGWVAIEGRTAKDDKLVMYDFFGVHVGTIFRELVEEGNGWQEITPELVEGTWYVTNLGAIGRLDEKSKTGTYSYLRDAVNEDKIICYSISLHANNIEREATKEEIHKALDAIRIEKGLVEGVKVKDVNGAIIELERDGTCYLKAYDALMGNHAAGKGVCIYSGTLYKQGNWASKASEPILVTEDGYEIFHGGRYYYVDQGFRCDSAMIAKGMKVPKCNKRFKHKENAQAYIEQHKPRFSRADLECYLGEVKDVARKAFENGDSIERTALDITYKIHHIAYENSLNQDNINNIQNLKQSK